MNRRNNHLDLADLRARLDKAKGKEYWRSLEEIAETPEFEEFLQNEFRPGASERSDPVNRRELLKLLGASLGLAGLTACTKQPQESIVPYVRAPEEFIPGKPLFYATAISLAGIAAGVLVESHMGRPTKVEGNPQHPGSLGATDCFAQASVLTLYDPDRSQVTMREGRISSWVRFLATVSTERERQLAKKGAGLRILTETVTSPTLARQLRDALTEFPEAKWHQYEPAGRDAARTGTRLAFGEPLNAVYRFDHADVTLALDADFLASGPGSVRYARDFASRRRAGVPNMSRLYAVEAYPSPTGSLADHRLPLANQDMENFARAMAASLGVGVENPGSSAPGNWIKAVAADLEKHRGASLVVAGDHQPPNVHALAHAMNHALGNVGKTVIYTDPVEANPVDQMASLRDLVDDMKAGRVETLLMLGGNPVFNAPADLNFREHLLKVPLRIHLSLYQDETSELCHWHIPEAHPLEAWGDARAYDGTVTIVQPLIAPLYEGKSALEMLTAWAGKPGRSSYELVREYWQNQKRPGNFEELWRTALHDGLVAGTALPAKTVSLRKDFLAATPAPKNQEGMEINFRPDPTIGDGRFANNGWLQELPKPLTKLTWDNAAFMSPATAESLGVANEQVVELNYQGRTLRMPAWVVPGQADQSVTVHFGYGRTRGGKIADGTGFNVYSLRTSAQPWSDSGLQIRRTAAAYRLVSTQHHSSMEGRNLVRVATLEEYNRDPQFAHAEGHEPGPELSLYPGFKYDGYAWGMAIDLNACTGCGACVIACQAENNIAVVGKKEVGVGREMHWIRIDRYYKGGLDDPEIYHQPVPCMHCENAPCEVVCPVGATVHSAEGLNQMVYNRCVGTRYCSNNCPYKVRRFNFYLYSNWTAASLEPLRNPDVTVRSRGVMEKCTYCVQRINAAKIDAEKEDRRVRDGEIVTACQAVCPTQAIVFGDINDPESRVAKLKRNPLNYGLLAELNTRPRTTYLGRLRNPNPELDKG
jgi:MoCo/4Fe-4S cofactor protein with predicted Tat translocation signal